MTRATALLIALAAVAADAAAETRYVTDELEVPVRSGKSLEHKILRMLPSGTAVEVLETSEGYTSVRTARGLEGWVLTRYLSEQPSARERLASVEAENAVLREKGAELAEGARAASAAGAELDRSLAQLREQNARLQTEIEELRRAAADPVALRDENERIRAELAGVRSDLEAARIRADLLGNPGYRQWFLAGGGVTLAGLLIGLVLPRIAARRRRTAWDRL